MKGLLDGFHALQQNIYALIIEFLTHFLAKIAEFLQLSVEMVNYIKK